MISPKTIEEIKNRVQIVDIIEEFVVLKKTGHNYKGLCPFHGERTPSFVVSPTKNFFHCFGCHKKGNAVSFLMEHEKLSFVEALRWIAKKYNIEIEETETSATYKEQQMTSESLLIINKCAHHFFQQQLTETEEGKNIALTYLKDKRRFNEEVIKKFEIGFNPHHYHALSQTLIQQQFNKELLLKTGLVVNNRNNELVDNYRNRIIFPIHSLQGYIIGFGAREIMSHPHSPKYINTPENELYNKSKTLYGLFFAKQSIVTNDECLLVEGYTDVVSMHQSNIFNVVASGGTALTLEQLKLIRRFTKRLTIVYDGDEAGINAALRGLSMALAEGLYVKIVLFPNNEDPDSYAKKYGAEQLRIWIEKEKKDAILFTLERLLQNAGNDIHKKNEVVNTLAEIISKITAIEDFAIQHAYAETCAQQLHVDIVLFKQLISQYHQKEEKKYVPQVTIAPATNTSPLTLVDPPNKNLIRLEKKILELLIEKGEEPISLEKENGMLVSQYIIQEMEKMPFEEPTLVTIFQIIEQKIKEKQFYSLDLLLYHNDSYIQSMAQELIPEPIAINEKWAILYPQKKSEIQKKIFAEVKETICNYQYERIKKEKEENQKKILIAQSEEEKNEYIHIENELNILAKEKGEELKSVIRPK